MVEQVSRYGDVIRHSDEKRPIKHTFFSVVGYLVVMH